MKIDGLGAAVPGIPVQNGSNPVAEEFRQIFDKALVSKEDKELKKASQQMEALFINQMFSRMRNTVEKGGLFEQSMGEGIFTGMLDYEISTRASEREGIGLAKMIYEQFSRK